MIEEVRKGFFKIYLFIYFWLHHTACEILDSHRGLNLYPLQWKSRVLTTGLSGSERDFFLRAKWDVFTKRSHFRQLGLNSGTPEGRSDLQRNEICYRRQS